MPNKEMNNGERQRKEAYSIAQACHRKRKDMHFNPSSL
jgi:hypothetical protein